MPTIFHSTVVFAVSLAIATATNATSFDILAVEANEGDSSGGHLAIRFDDQVFHYQHYGPGLLQLRRDRWDDFRYRYSDLGNRGIRIVEVASDDDEVDELRDRLASELFAQRRQLALLEAAADTTQLLDRLPGENALEIEIPAAGFFDTPPDLQPVRRPGCAALAEVRDRVRAHFGANALAREAARIDGRIRALSPTEHQVDSRTDYPRGLAFSESLRQAAELRVAIEILSRAPCLRTELLRPSATDSLSAAQRRTLAQYIDDIGSRLVDLFASPREDRGGAMLVAMARLGALGESLAANRLLVVDALPDDADEIDPTSGRVREPVLRALLEQASRDADEAQQELFAAARPLERLLTQVEAATSRHYELTNGVRSGTPIRVRSGPLIPSRAATWSGLPKPRPPAGVLAQWQARAVEAEAHALQRMQALWRYDLIASNCASEIIEQLPRRPESLRGRLLELFAFIPAVADDVVGESYTVVSTSRIAPFRERYLERESRTRGSIKVALRESNRLTSRLYGDWGASDDSLFLFFPPRSALLRPLAGAGNLGVTVAATIGSVPAAINGDFEPIRAAARGAVFSIPELFFVPIRKGSFEYVPANERF